jgi:hypothetical protein
VKLHWTHRGLIASLGVMLCVAGCGQKNGNAPRKTETTTMQPKSMTPETMEPRAVTPEPMRPVATKPGPYPKKWIREARYKHRMSTCQRLVYKKGCSVLRKGSVTLQITLAADGSVKSVKALKNTVHVDPKLVLDCFRNGVAKWRFTPPKDVLPTFTIRFTLSDKC